MTDKRIALKVTPAAERALRKGHPWLFDQAIREQSHEGQPGDLAVIFDQKRRFLAIGLYDPESPIRVKILHHRKPARIDQQWFYEKLKAAAQIRQPLQDDPDTNGYRLVHGENDSLPGLIVDKYGGTLVVKIYTNAWLPHFEGVLKSLHEVESPERVVLRLGRMVKHNVFHDGQVIYGDPLDEPLIFSEHGLRFYADVIHGHKTGFFFDQRDNRAEVRKLAKGHTVLDVFAYVGAFSVNAAYGGAESVTSLDISEPAMQEVQRNFALNDINTPHEIIVADAFAGLDRLASQGRTFSMVIVDPPSFAKSQDEVGRALSSYSQLAKLAQHVLEPGGIFVMASCSSRVSKDEFLKTINPGNMLKPIKITQHALDHPITFPEGAYLKCFYAYKG